MSARSQAYPQEVRDYLIAQVLDNGQKLGPVLEKVNAGQAEGVPKCPVSYPTAYGWLAKERRSRDAALPLNDTTVEAFRRRLFSVAQRELRKVERDAKLAKPLDAKRLNDLESFIGKMSRHLHDEPDEATTGSPGSTSLLERLAAEAGKTAQRDNPTPQIHPKPTTSDGASSDHGTADGAADDSGTVGVGRRS